MPTSLLLMTPLILAIGAGLALQSVVNTALSRFVTPFGAAFLSVGVTFLCLAIPVALNVAGSRTALSGALQSPAYLFIGGFCGAALLIAAPFLVPQVGAATFVALIVAGQLIGSLLLDETGAFGLERHAITPIRILGAALLLVGTRLIAWR